MIERLFRYLQTSLQRLGDERMMMIIITVIIIVIGILLSADDFSKKEVKLALKKVSASIVLAIAANLIWTVAAPYLYHTDTQVGDESPSNYTEDSQNSNDAQHSDGLQYDNTQNDPGPHEKDDTPEKDDALGKDNPPGKDKVPDNDNSANNPVTSSPAIPKLQVYDVVDSEENAYANPSFPKNEVENIGVSFLNYSGTIFESGQENSYEFIAPENGKYRCELSDMVSGFKVSVYLYDASGSRIDYNTSISNGSGITVELLAGNFYKLVVKSSTGTGNYNIFVGQQKEVIDISNCTTVNDSVEFTGQENKYFYTPTVTGIHRFWISQISSGVKVSVYIYDEAGYRVDYNTSIGIDSGITVTLTAGQSYSVIIKQSTGYDSYVLSVGPQKPTIDISAYTAITDSTEFANQTNNYLYTANVSGIHRFQISQINSGIRVSIYVYDAAGYRLNYNTSIGQGSGVTVTLDKGETYSIVIKQATGYNSYTMSIGSPKEIANISGYDVVNDSIQFYDQENIYTYIPAVNGTYKLSLGNVVSGVKISVYIYDDADYRINYATGMSNTSSLSASLEANRTYVIKAKYSSNYGSYSLSIDFNSK